MSTFSRQGSLYHNKDRAHLYSLINLTRSVLQFNSIIFSPILKTVHIIRIILIHSQQNSEPANMHSNFFALLFECRVPIVVATRLPQPLKLESSMDIYDFASNLVRSSFNMGHGGKQTDSRTCNWKKTSNISRWTRNTRRSSIWVICFV